MSCYSENFFKADSRDRLLTLCSGYCIFNCWKIKCRKTKKDSNC